MFPDDLAQQNQITRVVHLLYWRWHHLQLALADLMGLQVWARAALAIATSALALHGHATTACDTSTIPLQS